MPWVTDPTTTQGQGPTGFSAIPAAGSDGSKVNPSAPTVAGMMGYGTSAEDNVLNSSAWSNSVDVPGTQSATPSVFTEVWGGITNAASWVGQKVSDMVQWPFRQVGDAASNVIKPTLDTMMPILVIMAIIILYALSRTTATVGVRR